VSSTITSERLISRRNREEVRCKNCFARLQPSNFEKMKLEIPPSKEINVPRARNLSSLVLYIKLFSKLKVFYNVMYVIPYSVCLFLMKFLFRLPWISCLYWLYSGQTLASIGWRLPKTWSHSTFACAKRVFSRQTL